MKRFLTFARLRIAAAPLAAGTLPANGSIPASKFPDKKTIGDFLHLH